MHELSVGQALLEQIAAVARQQHARRVDRVTVCIGVLSGVEPALLRAAYEALRADTVAEHADLAIVPVPVRVFCESCGAESETPPNRLVCPCCGGFRTVLLAGHEMMLESVDLTVRARD